MTVRHFLVDDDLSPTEQREVLNLAADLKVDPFAARPFDGPRSVAIISDKPTLRTQVSFTAGIAELGGHPLMVDGRLAGIGHRESISDSAQVLGRHVAAIVWRTGAQSRLEEMAQHAGVPVVNALSDNFHPCQILADWQTIREHKGELTGMRLAYLGDGANNMAHSYLLGGATAGMHIRIGAPVAYHPEPAVVARAEAIARQTGGSVLVTDSATDAAADAEVVATDTWVSMGQEAENDARTEIFTDYAVTERLLAQADSEAIVMHCLPAHRGEEITAEIIDGPRSVVFDQAENRRHAQKAVLVFLDARARMP